MKNKVGISTGSLNTRLCSVDALDQIARMQVDIAEVFLSGASEYSPSYAKRLKIMSEDTHVQIYSVHALCTQFEPQLFAGNTTTRKDATDVFKALMQLCETVNARVYVMHGISLYRNKPFQPDMHFIAEQLNNLSEIARQFDVTIALENVYWCMYHYPGFMNDLKKAGLSRSIKNTFDIKQAVKSGEDKYLYLSEMGKDMINIHLSDISAAGEDCLPGKGGIDFLPFFQTVQRLEYQGPYIVEVYSKSYDDYAQLAQSINYLRDIVTTLDDTYPPYY